MGGVSSNWFGGENWELGPDGAGGGAGDDRVGTGICREAEGDLWLGGGVSIFGLGGA